MPTPAERNALLFLAGVALVGGGVRVLHSAKLGHEVAAAERLAGGPVRPTDASSALEAQLAAVDSARKTRGSTGKASTSKTDTRSRAPRRRVAKTDSAPQERPKRTRLRDSSPETKQPKLPIQRSRGQPQVPVDINRATAAELEQLPRIGPALAARIVAWRIQHGPFRSMDDLRHVHGIGTTVSSLLQPMVTF